MAALTPKLAGAEPLQARAVMSTICGLRSLDDSPVARGLLAAHAPKVAECEDLGTRTVDGTPFVIYTRWRMGRASGGRNGRKGSRT